MYWEIYLNKKKTIIMAPKPPRMINQEVTSPTEIQLHSTDPLIYCFVFPTGLAQTVALSTWLFVSGDYSACLTWRLSVYC